MPDKDELMATPVIEVAQGVVDGVNANFKTSHTYIPGSVQIWQDGQLLRKDYDDGWAEVAPDRFRTKIPPKIGSVIQVFYLAI